MDKIVEIYPTYNQIYKKLFQGKKIKDELDQLYNPLFINYIIPNYYELMLGIDIIVNKIKEINNVNDIELIDFLEFIFGNILYETFLFEYNKIHIKDVKIEQINIFKYIIMVELYKFKIYKNTITSMDIESKFLPVLIQRSRNCELKISLCLKIISSNSQFLEVLKECNNLIKDSDKDIEVSINKVKKYSSFIKLGY